MNLTFRTLEPHEIECKTVVNENCLEISLHTQAHTCTNILNEAVGVLGWEKQYTSGNKNCIVRIWDKDKGMWISKEDCGGSLTELDGLKGQASNGFKRVCALGWGLGIELYSQPKITLPMTDANTIYDHKKGMLVSEKYSIKEIEFDEKRNISRCVIVNSSGVVVYDGPDENGKSRPVDTDCSANDVPVIPEDADLINSEDEEFDEYTDERDVISKDTIDPVNIDLPDNTDGYDMSGHDFAASRKDELEFEIKRTHVKKTDVLKKLGIAKMDDLDNVDEFQFVTTLEKLKELDTYVK